MKNKRVFLLIPGALVLLGLLLVAVAGALPSGPRRSSLDAVEGAWGSGWVAVPNVATPMPLTHDLGGNPDDYAVALWFADTDDGYGINTLGYGGFETGDQYYGGYWQNLTAHTIEINRNFHDIYADLLRVFIWVPETPDYCSDWQPIAPGATETFTHGLGGDPDDYTVRLWFSDTLPAGLGVNHRHYGGLEDDGSYYGAYWHNLTASSVQVTRLADDGFAGQVRVCVAEPDPPDWDSGWQALNQGESRALAHGLGGNPMLYVVRMDQRQSNLGIHHFGIGGLVDASGDQGSHWQNLTASAITVARHADDQLVDEVRVRIWQVRVNVYLPYVVNNAP